MPSSIRKTLGSEVAAVDSTNLYFEPFSNYRIFLFVTNLEKNAF